MNEENTEAEATTAEEEQKYRLRTIISDQDVMTLREESEPVALVIADNSGNVCLDKETTELIQTLKDYVVENDGLGMAAVQLGELKRVFVMRKPFNSDRVVAIINPTLLRSEGQSTKGEGCFSMPNLPGDAMVKRASRIFVNYTDENGADHQEELFVGMDARIFQHELDHLNGVLMIDKKPSGYGMRGWGPSF